MRWLLVLLPAAAALNYRCQNDQVLIVQSFGNDTIRMHCQSLDMCGYQQLRCDYDEFQPQCGGLMNFVAHVIQNTPTSPVEHTCCNLFNPRPPHSIPTHVGNDCFIYELPDGTANANERDSARSYDSPYTVLKSAADIPQHIDGISGYRLRLYLLKNKAPPTLLVKGIERRLEGYRVTICRPRCTSYETIRSNEEEPNEWKAIAWSSWTSSTWSTWARSVWGNSANGQNRQRVQEVGVTGSSIAPANPEGDHHHVHVHVNASGNNNNLINAGAAGESRTPNINITVHTGQYGTGGYFTGAEGGSSFKSNPAGGGSGQGGEGDGTGDGRGRKKQGREGGSGEREGERGKTGRHRGANDGAGDQSANDSGDEEGSALGGNRRSGGLSGKHGAKGKGKSEGGEDVVDGLGKKGKGRERGTGSGLSGESGRDGGAGDDRGNASGSVEKGPKEGIDSIDTAISGIGRQFKSGDKGKADDKIGPTSGDGRLLTADKAAGGDKGAAQEGGKEVAGRKGAAGGDSGAEGKERSLGKKGSVGHGDQGAAGSGTNGTGLVEGGDSVGRARSRMIGGPGGEDGTTGKGRGAGDRASKHGETGDGAGGTGAKAASGEAGAKGGKSDAKGVKSGAPDSGGKGSKGVDGRGGEKSEGADGKAVDTGSGKSGAAMRGAKAGELSPNSTDGAGFDALNGTKAGTYRLIKGGERSGGASGGGDLGDGTGEGSSKKGDEEVDGQSGSRSRMQGRQAVTDDPNAVVGGTTKRIIDHIGGATSDGGGDGTGGTDAADVFVTDRFSGGTDFGTFGSEGTTARTIGGGARIGVGPGSSSSLSPVGAKAGAGPASKLPASRIVPPDGAASRAGTAQAAGAQPAAAASSRAAGQGARAQGAAQQSADPQAMQKAINRLKKMNCFPAEALVTTVTGQKRMDQLAVGDFVLVPSAGDVLKYERVEMFYHREPETRAQFVVLFTESKKRLALTPLHLIPFGECLTMRSDLEKPDGVDKWLRASRFADKATIGNCLMSISGNGEVVAERIVKIGRQVSAGIYSPITVGGALVVDGVLSSCFSQVESHTVQKLVFDFLIYAYEFFGYSPGRNVSRQGIPSFINYVHELSHVFLPFSSF